MRGYYFNIRCYENELTERPFRVCSFIVCGTNLARIKKRAEELFTFYASLDDKICGKQHRTGPLLINPNMLTRTGKKEINWPVLAKETEKTLANKPKRYGISMFEKSFERWRIPKYGWKQLLPPEKLKELSLGGDYPFIASAYNDKLHERVGRVTIIYASSVEETNIFYQTRPSYKWAECIHIDRICHIYPEMPAHK